MKLLIADTMSFLMSFMYSRKNFEYENCLPLLKKDGVVVIEDYLAKEEASTLKKEVLLRHEEHFQQLKLYDEGCDSRFFGVNDFLNFSKGFLNPDFCIDICNVIQGTKSNKKVTMSNHLIPMKGNSGSGGGWHRDSPYSNQFKSFLFLSDVNIDNGPFSIIKGSHLRKNIEVFSKVLGVKTSQYRFSENEIQKAIELLSWKETKLTCSAGTLVLANTRALHRGSPIYSGERVALTNYYFRKEIPKHFGVAGV